MRRFGGRSARFAPDVPPQLVLPARDLPGSLDDLRVRCARQTATASASEASRGSGSSVQPRIAATIRWTCLLPAAPEVVTARLISEGVISSTGTPARASSASTTPRASPIRSADAALFPKNAFSTAARSGLCSRTTSAMPSAMYARRSPTAAPRFALSAPQATSRGFLASVTTPQPSICVPGSTPRMRTVRPPGISFTAEHAEITENDVFEDPTRSRSLRSL